MEAEGKARVLYERMPGAEIILPEGIRLPEAEEGVCFLHAAPMNPGGAEGAGFGVNGRADLKKYPWDCRSFF